MLNKERIINLLQWFILLAMFAYDGFTYLPEESNFALLKSVYYVFIFTAFVLIACLQMREAKLPVHPTNLISYGIQIFVWLYFVRLFYDFMIAGVEQEIVTNPFAGQCSHRSVLRFSVLQVGSDQLTQTQHSCLTHLPHHGNHQYVLHLER